MVMGRPTSDKKENTLKIRLSKTDENKLEFCSKETGKTKSEIIRLGIDKIYNELKK